jgi:hypothetical protein
MYLFREEEKKWRTRTSSAVDTTHFAVRFTPYCAEEAWVRDTKVNQDAQISHSNPAVFTSTILIP